MKEVIVVGGGPAGLFASIQAAKKGARVKVFEKMDRPARKLLITGKGRCNITNQADVQQLVENIPGNGEFLYSAFYKFNNVHLIEFFNNLGIKTKVERGGRVFPESDKAVEVVDALVKCARVNGVEIISNANVEEIVVEGGRIKGLRLKDKKEYYCDSLILAVGGMSYPATGSTGDGFKMAGEVGHKLMTPRPSLVPLETEEEWVKELQGLSLKNVSVRFVLDGKKVLYDDFGEMIFTHFGVSGPIIISASRHLLDVLYKKKGDKRTGKVKLLIDLKPALTNEKLDERIQRDFSKFSNKYFGNALDELMPRKLIPVIIGLSGIDAGKRVNQITKTERLGLVQVLKKIEVTIKGFRPIEEAIITAGGICTDEINPSTMESRIVKGLFFAGEIIDVDGYTGGFNLQIAFSSVYSLQYFSLQLTAWEYRMAIGY